MPALSPDRPTEIAAFLDGHGWGAARVESFEGDFSPRRYARLIREDGRTAILMDADRDQKTPSFVALAPVLRDCGLHTPEIYATAANQGLVLMQDFGTRNVGAVLDQGADPLPFLLRGVEILAQLHSRFNESMLAPLALPQFNLDYFIAQAELLLDAYFPYVKNRTATEEERRDFCAAWRTVLAFTQTLPQSLVLRDYITDNLMEQGDGSLGVLDFQDAGMGPTAYDLMSLCDEVRRDGAFVFLPQILDHYQKKLAEYGGHPVSDADQYRGCILLSAQRHTRTLGNVTRTALARGQQARLAYLPRLRAHLNRLLAAPYLMPVRQWMADFDEDIT